MAVFIPNLKNITPTISKIQATWVSGFFFINLLLLLLLLFAHYYISHKMQTHTSIKLKCGMHKGIIKTNLSTNFDLNLLKIYRVMKNYLHSIRSKGLLHLQDKLLWGMSWNLACTVDGVTIVGMPFLVWKKSR